MKLFTLIISLLIGIYVLQAQEASPSAKYEMQMAIRQLYFGFDVKYPYNRPLTEWEMAVNRRISNKLYVGVAGFTSYSIPESQNSAKSWGLALKIQHYIPLTNINKIKKLYLIPEIILGFRQYNSTQKINQDFSNVIPEWNRPPFDETISPIVIDTSDMVFVIDSTSNFGIDIDSTFISNPYFRNEKTYNFINNGFFNEISISVVGKDLASWKYAKGKHSVNLGLQGSLGYRFDIYKKNIQKEKISYLASPQKFGSFWVGLRLIFGFI
ncbi:MAG: hypothetical protein IPL35_11615 [Sphingobacteriales bacterium]|nr:hypothetical protein [Sphingobacteriales bacterium]